MANYLNPEICKNCGGYCCSKVAGCCLPEDFGNDIDLVEEALRLGRFCVDWWEGDPREDKFILSRAYFIRPVGKGMEGILTDPTWGSIGCTFQAENGCELPPEQRPAGCRLLEPSENGAGCKSHGGDKKEAALAWLEYDIGQVIDRLAGRTDT